MGNAQQNPRGAQVPLSHNPQKKNLPGAFRNKQENAGDFLCCFGVNNPVFCFRPVRRYASGFMISVSLFI